MANVIYNSYKGAVGKINWEDNTNVSIKVMLVADTYTPDVDLHTTKGDIDAINGAEVTGTGYTAGGQAVVNRSIVIDNNTDYGKYDADDVTWANSTITARGAIVYFDTGTAGTSTLITYVDFVSNKSSNSGDFLIQWNADGVFKIG